MKSNEYEQTKVALIENQYEFKNIKIFDKLVKKMV